MTAGEFMLLENESIEWEAKPAPRCYTFRHWRHSIFGLVFLAICSYWSVLGVEMSREYSLPWLAWLPIPFVVTGIYFSVGHLLQARLEWNNVRYMMTSQRLVALRGITRVSVTAIDLADVSYFKREMHGDDLGTLRVHAGESRQIVLHCLEHPGLATDLLERTINNNLGSLSSQPDQRKDQA